MLYQRRMEGGYWTNGLNEADDSPRIALAHEYISTTCTQALSAEILAKMARLVGRDDLAGWFAGDYRNLGKLVNARFWDEEHKLYNDLGPDGKPITVTKQGGVCKHCHDFWPLICGLATGDRARLMAEAATDPKSFLVTCGVASLSADSDGFNKDTGAYWRGSVWPPVQCMVIKGLERAGNEQAAQALAHRYYDAFLTAYKAKGDITEFLVPGRPEMLGCGKFVGWGGVAPVQILIEDILGIRPDAPANRIIWHIRRLERHGIENLHFDKHVVSLICEARASETDPCAISVTSDGKFDLVIDLDGKQITKGIRPGSNTLRIALTR
jgi:glycogen debranching enzyme